MGFVSIVGKCNNFMLAYMRESVIMVDWLVLNFCM